MEYLEMNGAVKLRERADMSKVSSILNKLLKTEFIGSGFMDIKLEGSHLGICAEGVIADSYSIKPLLKTLQGQLSKSSMIGVTTARWETLIVFKHNKPISALRLQPKDQLIFAQ